MNRVSKYFQHNIPNIKDFFKYVGPGFIVTVGFIDPGNWATNIQAGATYGYTLLWVVSLSTLILIILQYNASKLGIVSGKCLAEALTSTYPKKVSRTILITGMIATIATILAELLGGAIALQMIFNLPIYIGTIIITIITLFLIFTNTYNRIEGIIIGFISIIGLSFIVELMIANVDWFQVSSHTFVPTFDQSAIIIIMGIIGAVVMPHNLFLHSEFIQSRKWEKNDDESLKKQLKLAKTDTIVSMVVGWAINSAMIILAATTFYKAGIIVTELAQAQQLLIPLLGKTAAGVFALALLFSGIASSITAGMCGGVINAGMFEEEFNINDRHTSIGVIGCVLIAALSILFISNPFDGLIYSQVFLSIQLPITILSLIKLTNNKDLMKNFSNNKKEKILLYSSAFIIILLNIVLLALTIFN